MFITINGLNYYYGKKAFFDKFDKFGGKYTTVKDFYNDFKDDITFVDLKDIL